MPTTINELDNIPLRYNNGPTVFLMDVGQVHEGWTVQRNIGRENGQHSAMLSVTKNGNASALAFVNGVCRWRARPHFPGL